MPLLIKPLASNSLRDSNFSRCIIIDREMIFVLKSIKICLKYQVTVVTNIIIVDRKFQITCLPVLAPYLRVYLLQQHQCSLLSCSGQECKVACQFEHQTSSLSIRRDMPCIRAICFIIDFDFKKSRLLHIKLFTNVKFCLCVCYAITSQTLTNFDETWPCQYSRIAGVKHRPFFK